MGVTGVCACVCGGVSDPTGARSHSTGRGMACSHRGDLGSGHRSSPSDTCRTGGLLCCAGSSVGGTAHWSFSDFLDCSSLAYLSMKSGCKGKQLAFKLN